jgi:hypothetical protein
VNRYTETNGDNIMKTESVFFNKPLQQDEIFVNSKVVSLSEITGMPVRKRLAKAIVSEGQIVNVVSGSYGHLPNEVFFTAAEEALINADINYSVRSINRENRSFSVDYILNDESYHINIKNGLDSLRPMIRLTNSYDGTCKTSGHFGFFREVCHNGLHVANTNIGFSVRHTGSIQRVVMPALDTLVQKFMDNEYYSLHKKFEVMAERPIENIEEWVKLTCEQIKLFTYSASEKNPTDPSANARLVIDAMKKESRLLDVEPNMWLGYNAFNEVLHGKLKKTFEAQHRLDANVFNAVYAMATN